MLPKEPNPNHGQKIHKLIVPYSKTGEKSTSSILEWGGRGGSLDSCNGCPGVDMFIDRCCDVFIDTTGESLKPTHATCTLHILLAILHFFRVLCLVPKTQRPETLVFVNASRCRK